MIVPIAIVLIVITYLLINNWNSNTDGSSVPPRNSGSSGGDETDYTPEASTTVQNIVRQAVQSNTSSTTALPSPSDPWRTCPAYREVDACNFWQINNDGSILWPPTGQLLYDTWYDIMTYGSDASGTRLKPCACPSGVFCPDGAETDDHKCCWGSRRDQYLTSASDATQRTRNCVAPDDCQTVCARFGRSGSNRRCVPTNSEPGQPNNRGWAWTSNQPRVTCPNDNQYDCVCGASL